MAKELKNSKMASFKIRTELIEQLDKYSNDTGISKTRIVEDAIKLYMEKHNS